MSYHVLHHFDEQWFEDVRAQESHGDDAHPALPSGAWRAHSAGRGLRFHLTRQWTLMLVSLALAAFALFLAYQSRRHAADLEQRVIHLEQSRR